MIFCSEEPATHSCFAKYVSHQGKRTIFRYMLVNTFCAKSLVSTDSPSRFYVLFLPLGNTILENTKEYFLQHLMSILKKKNKSAAEKGVFLQKQQKSDPNFTSSRLQMFCKIVCFKNFAKFTGKHICRILFFDKVTVL